MASSLVDEDDRAFQAALSFVNECVLDDEELEDAAAFRTTAMMQREDEWAAMSCGLAPTVNISGVETSLGALGGYEMAATVSALAAKPGASNRDKLRRRTETNERKKLLRKAGIYEDANWMSKDSRLEVAYLQERIEKLQLDLQVLQSRKSRRPAIQPGAQDPTDDALQIPKVWEDIAIRQQRRLKAAERENSRLKLAVQNQQKVANCMTNLVRKRAGHLTNDCASFMSVDFSMLSSRGIAGDFPLLFRHLETAHQEVDAVFASNGLANMVLTPSDVHIREGVNGKYLEAFSNKVLPFGLRAATEATWDHFKGGEKHLGNGVIYEKTSRNLDDPYTILEEFTKEMHSKNARADIKAQQLIRRYMEPDRDIVIWVSVAEPAEIKHKKLRGLTYHLRGYAMTKRSPASTPEHEVSQLQCVSLISLEPKAEAIDMVFLLEDDDGVAAAALSFVDECALDEVASASSTESSTVSVGGGDSSSSEPSTDARVPIVQSARCKAPVRVTSREEKIRRRMEINEKTRILRKAGVYADSNRVRNGRTREIAFLREQLERLQIDLETLKKQKKVGRLSTTAGTSSGQSSYGEVSSTSQNSKMWQAVLDIQRRRREEAECENIRLKLIVERQRKVADSMTSSLQKRVAGLVNDCSGFIRQNCVQHPLVHVLAFCGDMGDFGELFRHLEAAYQEVDAVFAVNGLVHMVETSDDVHIRAGGDGTYAEAFSNKVLHFGLQVSAEATWDHFKANEKHLGNGNIYEKTARYLDEPYTVVEEFTKELFSRRSRADIKVKQVIRRYVEPDRDIVIWVARVSPAEIKHKMLSGLTYQLRGYAMTKRSSTSTRFNEVSQLQCCSMISLDQDAAAKYSPENMRALSNFLIASTALKIQAHQDRIESALVERALTRQLT
ncbi:hypothetical protein PHYSODRAFT_247606 [Phytophthora sojae]|uniref:M96 mating-specific protein family n=1 Tax=Phytophthora sojae (strain P6497) TaxID=1094619 RepID=G4YPD3_PHYSP|nr:hypothetical protein PHYSODRAFT_247606 [Phytophthora sojae]EGZ27913.1 hypothetical protein PHYSODRAFT_247606 [Phytophthora sojae]|eukprot:XP_009515188.1 hypothetical protein PHYSODRAFT_247606 [Phytophthora sojae]